jgi:hypothetical protein
MELHELEILREISSSIPPYRNKIHGLLDLICESSSGNHGGSIASASVGRCAGEVGTAVAAGGQHGVLGPDPVQRSVLHVQRQNTTALAILHEKVKGKILDEVVAVVAERLAVQGVQQRVASAVGNAAAPSREVLVQYLKKLLCWGLLPVSLTTLAELKRLTTESALVNFTLVGSAEWHTWQ